MMMESFGSGGLDYDYCTYRTGGARFRGPRHPLTGEFIAAIGGTETFGKFVAQPWPALIEQMTAVSVANLGVAHGSAALFSQDDHLLARAARARIAVLQLTGVEGLSNNYYRVHPRRNDRVIAVSDKLRALYPGVDFTQICFVRHLIAELKRASPDTFRRIRDELRREWAWRHKDLLDRLTCPVILLWLSRRRPDAQCRDLARDDPLFVDRRMIEGLRPHADEVVEVQIDTSAEAGDLRGMIHGPLERPAAELLPGPRTHAEIAMALYDSLIRVAGNQEEQPAPTDDAGLEPPAEDETRAPRSAPGRP